MKRNPGESKRWVAALLWILGVLAVAAGAQQRGRGPKVSAQLSTGVANLGEQVVLNVVAEDAREARILEIPSVEGLTLSSPRGPSTSSFTRIVNGRVHEQFQRAWSLTVRAAGEGEYEIPPFVLEVDGQRMSTSAVTLKVVRDLRGENLGFVEVRASSPKVVEGQPFTLEVRFGWDAQARINYANLSLPWWRSLPGTIELERGETIPEARRVEGVFVNDRFQVVCEELEPEDGRRVLRLTRSILPVRSGTIAFPTSFLEFGRIATRSRGFLSTRQEKVSSFYVRADPFELEVVPLPDEGQPFDFTGAVGTLEARASVDTRDVLVGDSIKLAVGWSGEGNLEFFGAPDLERLDGFRDFRVYGTTEEKSPDRRVVTYDVAPLTDGVTEIPAVSLSVFDPVAGAYGAVSTAPVPIRVRPLERAITLDEGGDEGFERDILDVDTRPIRGPSGASEAAGPGDRVVWAALFAVPLAWLGLRTLVRRRGDPAAPLERRRRRAGRVLARSLAGETDARRAMDAFVAFLAARSREPDEAWIGRDAVRWTGARESRGDAETAAAVAAMLLRLEAAVYGGAPPVPASEILSLAERVRREGP